MSLANLTRLEKAVLVSSALAFILPVVFASIIIWSFINGATFIPPTEDIYTLQTGVGAVGAVFYAIVSILYIAFFWLVIASIIAGGIMMAVGPARPILEFFGLPIPKVTPEQGFRTIFSAIMAWVIVNVLLAYFGVIPPSPVSVYLSTITTGLTVGFVGDLVGAITILVINIPLIIYALGESVVIRI
jgi:hypothetical protein